MTWRRRRDAVVDGEVGGAVDVVGDPLERRRGAAGGSARRGDPEAAVAAAPLREKKR